MAFFQKNDILLEGGADPSWIITGIDYLEEVYFLQNLLQESPITEKVYFKNAEEYFSFFKNAKDYQPNHEPPIFQIGDNITQRENKNSNSYIIKNIRKNAIGEYVYDAQRIIEKNSLSYIPRFYPISTNAIKMFVKIQKRDFNHKLTKIFK